MIVKTTLLFLLAYTVSGKNVKIKTNHEPPLVWPINLSAEATMRQKSNGFKTHIKFWKSSDLYTRYDFNDISSTIEIELGFGTEYKIFYKTYRPVCTKEIGTQKKQITGTTFLPHFPSYKRTGNGTIMGISCIQFTGKTKMTTNHTFWAYYDHRRNSWIPKRYVRRVFLGKNIITDYIYDYTKFETNVNAGVFNIYKKYRCETKTTQGENNVGEIINEGFFEEFGSDKQMTGNVRMRRKIKKRSKTLQPINGLKLKDASDPILNTLSWPETYSVEATTLYLTSGWVKNLKYWKSKTATRLDDTNRAAETNIIYPEKGQYGIQYLILPKTTEEETNKVCYNKTGNKDDPVEAFELLPDISIFERVGPDVVRGRDCVKFTLNYNNEGTVLKAQLWVYFDNSTVVPVRLELQECNIRHGYIKNHEINDYFNFELTVNNEVFEVYNDYNCTVEKKYDDDNPTPNADYMKSMKAEEIKELDEAFDVYKQQFHKKYGHQAEHEMRKAIFYKNRRLVTETNHRNVSYKLALNKMSDRTKEEMKRYRGLRREKVRTAGTVPFPFSKDEIEEMSKSLPAEYDLRLEGVVGPVLDQQTCGSCWAFSATAAVEGALARSNGGTLISLSQQALVDCSWGMGNHGCDGGSPDNAFNWIQKYDIPTVEEYGPYIISVGYCNIENMTNTYKVRGWTDVPSEAALKIALITFGPVSVSLDATKAFSQYDGGIFYDTTWRAPKNLNHAVTVVGYGETDGKSFWIIKNSYGPFWGINGYMHISTLDNNCGIMTEPMYPVVW